MNLYHYTSLQALVSILGKGGITFWGTRYDSMNDPRDCIFAMDIALKELCEELPEENDFTKHYPYVVSFSKLEDNLNLWRLYHGQVCLEINEILLTEECENQNNNYFELPSEKRGNLIYFGDCEYATQDKESLQQALSNYNNRAHISDIDIYDKIQEFSAFVKDKDYEIEQEFRIIKFDYDGFSFNSNSESVDNMECQDFEVPTNIKVKPISSLSTDIVLYKEFKFTNKILKGIIIHEADNSKFKKLKEHLELLLRSRDYDMDSISIRQTKTYFRK